MKNTLTEFSDTFANKEISTAETKFANKRFQQLK